jgi:predicted Fe-Mo cluster-binding NifX family protein
MTLMKVAVSAGASGLDAPLDLRFGRCPFFVVVEIESMVAESYPNPSVNATSGAGIQTAQVVARLGVSALITGHVGPNALQSLSAAKIIVYKGSGGTVRGAVESFKGDELDRITTPSVPAHAGMGHGFGKGGAGGGSGRGGGKWGGSGSQW